MNPTISQFIAASRDDAPVLRRTEGRYPIVSPRMTVLFDTRAKHFDQNPYVRLLVESLGPDVEVVGFGWLRALLGRYDLVHLHWPEYLMRPGRRAPRSLAKLLTCFWMLRLVIQRKPILRTVHDKRPLFPLSASEASILRVVELLVRGRIWLQSPPPASGTSMMQPNDVVIPHGNYLPWISGQEDELRDEWAEAIEPEGPARRPVSSEIALLCFGILRPYKRFEQVIRAASRLRPPVRARLTILGSAPDEKYLALLRDEAQRTRENVTITGVRATDRELFCALLRSDLIVVPYDDVYNSGVALLALSADRPIAMRENSVARDLQQEFGSQWVYLWFGDLDEEKLTRILAQLRETRAPLRWPTARQWPAIGDLHREYYRRALTRGPRRRESRAYAAQP